MSPPHPMPKVLPNLRPAPIAFGAIVVDLGGTLISSYALLIVYIQVQLNSGVLTPLDLEADNGRALTDLFLNDPMAMVLSLLLGLLMTATGGFWAARMAGRLELFHGLAAGMVSLLAGEILFRDGGSLPLWYSVVGYGLHLPLAVAGAWLARERKAQTPPHE
ncbi:MAG: hypothetical protein ACPGUC_01540 [Gammaproteobacteria bacterium]